MMMSLEEALIIVEAMQKWRRGYGDKMPYSPTIYGLALDVLIANAKNILTKK